MCSISRTTTGFVVFIICFFGLWFEFTSDMTIKGPSARQRPWQEIAEEKRDRDMAKIPKDWIPPASILEEGRKRRSIAGDFIEGLLDKETLNITRLNVPEIVGRTSTGLLTSVKVVTAFCKRSAYAHQLVSTHPLPL